MSEPPPFNVLMQQAAKLKSAQMAQDRPKFDSWDTWYQNSMFSKEDIKVVRGRANYHESMEFAMECKRKGNDYFKNQDYDRAINEYERSLSLFEWVENKDAGWKNKGIQDNDLEEKKFVDLKANEVEAVRELKISNILNLSMCYFRSKEWPSCIKACNSVLALDKLNTKALYRRAQARIVPASCGTVENRMALEDLKLAVTIKPDDPILTNAFAKLKITLAKQKQKDKKAFSNFFERKTAGVAADGGGGGGGGGGGADMGIILDEDGNIEIDEAVTAYTTTSTSHSPSVQQPQPQDEQDITNTTMNTNDDSNTNMNSSGKKEKEKEKEPMLHWSDAFRLVKDMDSAACRYERDGEAVQAELTRHKRDQLVTQLYQYCPAHLHGELDKEVAGLSCSTSGSSSSSSSNKNSISANGDGDDNRAANSGGTGSSSSSTGSKHGVTTAAGAELSGEWYDVYRHAEDELDFSNPTPEMIDDARNRGLDITDSRVQMLMKEINKVRLQSIEREKKEKETPGKKSGTARNGKGLRTADNNNNDDASTSNGEHPAASSSSSQRMEKYMHEALLNIHKEESSRITDTLMHDLSPAVLKRMLMTRLTLMEDEEQEELRQEEVAAAMAKVSASTTTTTTTNGNANATPAILTPATNTSGGVSDGAVTVSSEGTIGGNTGTSTSNKKKKKKGKKNKPNAAVTGSDASAAAAANYEDEEVEEGSSSTSTSNTTSGPSTGSRQLSGGSTAGTTAATRLAASFPVGTGLPLRTAILGTAQDVENLGEREISRKLKTVMMEDIILLRQRLEREEFEKSSKRKQQLQSSADGAGAGAGTVVETAEEQEEARMSLSEEIVDMLELKYGTTYDGETNTTSHASALLICAVLVGIIACILIFWINGYIQSNRMKAATISSASKAAQEMASAAGASAGAAAGRKMKR